MVKYCKQILIMFVVIATVLGVSATEVSASNPYVGEIILVGFNFTPAGYETCDGQLLPIAENETLFMLIGTTYGGDGESTFALPDLRGLEPYPGTHYCISLFGVFPSQT